jgi:hypothetical protein
MIFWHPPVKYRVWWQSKLCEQYEMKGLATILVAKRLFHPAFNLVPANDLDLRW